VLDVRRAGEWQAGHLDRALWHPVDDFPKRLPVIAKDARVAVHCKSGYRSTIACSWLRRAGFTNVINVIGGYDAWKAMPASAA